MSACLVLVSLALFTSACANRCDRTTSGSNYGDAKEVKLVIPDGEIKASIDYDSKQNPCGSSANTAGLFMELCVDEGLGSVQLTRHAATAYRSSTFGDLTAKVLFYCVTKN